MEEGLDFPTAAIPVDQLNHRLKARHRAVRQQAPLHRLDARRRTDFSGNRAGYGNMTSLAVGQTDRAHPDLLRYPARWLAMACRQGEFNLAQNFAGQHGGPQFGTVRQAPVMLRTNQPVRRMPQVPGATHEFNDIGRSGSAK